MSLTTPVAVSICDRFDRPALVRLQPRLDISRPHGAAQVALQDFDVNAHATRAIAPDDREAAAFEYQDLVAPGEHVRECGFPGTVAVRNVDVGAARGVEDAGDVAQQAVGQGEQRPGIDIDRRPVHGPQHLVGHGRRSRNGQKFTPRPHAHPFDSFLTCVMIRAGSNPRPTQPASRRGR
jgi:hypothetical protein